jgi:hypothetical protein
MKLRAYFKMRGNIPSYSPISKAISVILKWPLSQSRFGAGSLALLLLGVSVPAAATLGEDASSVPADQTRLQAGLEVVSTAKFAVHRLRLPSGTTIKEYVSPAGMVFAVSWQGPEMPDLQQVLGRYFAAYVDALKSQGAGGVARAAERSGLVVQTGGHMRAFFGRAYVASMLPRGVSAEEIQ